MLNNRQSSYLKFTPEDVQQKIMEFQAVEEKSAGNKKSMNYEEEKYQSQLFLNKPRNSFGSMVMMTESEFNHDIIDTQVESNRTSQVKLS